MPGVNSLGIGSGVLTADVLDQLRAADDSVILTPIERKLEVSTQKEEASKLLSGFMSTFKQSTSALGNQNLYLGRVATGSNDNVTVTAQDGADLTSFNITDISKAEKDVWKSTAAFSDKTTTLTNLGTGTLTVSLGDTDYDIEYDASASLDDIRQEINDQAGSVMTASVIQISPDNYELIITAKDSNQAITFSDSIAATKQLNTVTFTNDAVATDTFTWDDGSGVNIALSEANGDFADGDTPATYATKITDLMNLDPAFSALYTAVATADGFTIESKTDGTNFTGTAGGSLAPTEEVTTVAVTSVDADSTSLASTLGLDNIQVAKASTFKYNGIAITRDTNNITDLVNGVTITLNQNQEATESAGIVIAQDDTTITTEMELLVTNFNLLSSNLRDMTLYDEEAGAAGIFSTESSIKSILRDLTRVLSQTETNGNSLYNYGLEIDREGVMSLDSSKFSTKLAEDPIALELLFRGASEIDAAKQLDTISLTNNVGNGDTFAWSDGNGNDINLSQANGDFDVGDTPSQSAAKIADLMNLDVDFSALYTATAIDGGFTIEAKKNGLAFNGIVTSVGAQTSTQDNTTKATSNSSFVPEVKGIFHQLDDKMNSFTGSNKILANFDAKLDTLKTGLISEYDKQKAFLDVRYETLTKKFAAYDSVINKLNNQFASLQLLIDAETSDN